MNTISAVTGKRILLGKQGDNAVTSVKFDVGKIISEYGSGGTFSLFNQRAGETGGYPVNGITVDGDILTWVVSSADLIAGNGKVQLQYTKNGAILHTEIWDTYCGESLSGDGTVPSPFVPWVNQLNGIKDAAVTASEHYPYIDSTSKHWMVWNVASSAFVDTGVNSEGISPHIGQNGHWYIGSTDTGINAKGDTGSAGADGVTPHVNQSDKHWYIGATDTGIVAQGQNGTNGSDGVTPHIGDNGDWFIGNTDTGVHAKGDKGDPGSDASVNAANVAAAGAVMKSAQAQSGYVPTSDGQGGYTWAAQQGSGEDTNSVHYTADSNKTDAQKAQARENIGAMQNNICEMVIADEQIEELEDDNYYMRITFTQEQMALLENEQYLYYNFVDENDEQLFYSGVFEKIRYASFILSSTITTQGTFINTFIIIAEEPRWGYVSVAGADYSNLERAAQQYSEMPDLSETPSTYLGKIVQYVGATNSTYTNGYFYKCVENDGVYSWQNVNVQAGGGGTSDFDSLTNRPSYNGTVMTHSTSIPEVKTAVWDGKQEQISDLTSIRSGAALGSTSVQGLTEMPTASAQYDGKIVQYVGDSTMAYTNGYFYKCRLSGSAYFWQNIYVNDPNAVNDFDLMNNRPSYNGTAMTHSTNIPEVPSISEYTAAEVDAAWEAVV